MKDTLIKMYEADIAKAKFNISVYFKNPAGIGEHPDLIQAVDSQLELMATAHDKIEVLKKYFDTLDYEDDYGTLDYEDEPETYNMTHEGTD